MSSSRVVAEVLRRSARAYAQAAVAELEAERPGSARDALPRNFASPVDDIEVRLLHLSEAVGVDSPELFADAASWYRTAFAHRDVDDDYLLRSLLAVRRVLARELPTAGTAPVDAAIDAAVAVAGGAPVLPPSPLERSGPHVDTARRFLLAALEGRADDALDLFRGSIATGAGVAELHDRVLVPVQEEVGRMWLLGEIPIADEHLTSQLVGQALLLLQAELPRPPADAPHVLAFGTSGNLHDIGLRIIAQRLQLAGCRVTNLGPNLPASDLPWALSDRSYDLMAVSATLLLHLSSVRAVVEERDRSLAGRPPILVGGAPFARVPDLHRRLGAEAGAGSAEAAVARARALLGTR